jgi:hypothetical protein
MAKKLTEGEEKAVEKAKASAIGVFKVDSNGNETLERIYSAAEHGEDFLKLAESRKSKIIAQGGKAILK